MARGLHSIVTGEQDEDLGALVALLQFLVLVLLYNQRRGERTPENVHHSPAYLVFESCGCDLHCPGNLHSSNLYDFLT